MHNFPVIQKNKNNDMQTLNSGKSLQNLSAKRVNSEQGEANQASKPTFRTIFISDIHLDTRDSKTRQLNHFLKHNSCNQLYLVGDIFDGWKIKYGIY